MKCRSGVAVYLDGGAGWKGAVYYRCMGCVKDNLSQTPTFHTTN